MWHTLAGFIAYAVGLVVMNSFDTRHIPHWLPHDYWLLLLPGVPLIYLASTIIRSVTKLDELKRKIHIEAMAFAGVATAFTCFSYLFLRDMGAPEFQAEWAFCLTWVYYVIGLFFSYRRYR